MPLQDQRFQLDDTIAALSSAPGPALRAILRISGPNAWSIVRPLLHQDAPQLPQHRAVLETLLTGVANLPPIPAMVIVFLGPRSYTGQDLLELHLPGSAPLVEAVLETLLNHGARLALPGEFTLRAFLSGKMDLTQAEALLAVLQARHPDSLSEALQQLAGNLAQPLAEVKERLLHLLAEIEASLDFPEEDLSFAVRETLIHQCRAAHDEIAQVLKQIQQRGLMQEGFRVVLTGRPNAGKSSLFNALLGRDAAIVSPQPGTTRDYLVASYHLDDVVMELVDTAGSEPVWSAMLADPAHAATRPTRSLTPTPELSAAITAQAQAFRQQQFRQADLVLYCLPVTEPITAEDRESLAQLPKDRTILVRTKCDLLPASSANASELHLSESGQQKPQEAAGWTVVWTSTLRRQGLAELEEILLQRARQHTRCEPLVVSLGRCQHHLARAQEALEQAESLLIHQEPPELVAVELRNALDELGAVLGEVYTEDLLDRIFSRFCIGK